MRGCGERWLDWVCEMVKGEEGDGEEKEEREDGMGSYYRVCWKGMEMIYLVMHTELKYV